MPRTDSDFYRVRFKNFHAGATVNLIAEMDMLPTINPMIPERAVSKVHFTPAATDGSA